MVRKGPFAYRSFSLHHRCGFSLKHDSLFAGVTFHETKAASVQHAAGSSTLTCSDGSQLHSSFVLDCTGHARKLVTFDEKFDPGYQAAYGMMIEVESHPFDLDTMLFMDWRDDHTKVLCWCCAGHV